MVITVKMMEELESEPADDSRGYVHSFSSFPSLQSTHLTDAWFWTSSFGFIH